MVTLHRIHRFCLEQSFYPLALSTLMGFAFFAGRVYLSHSRTYAFFVWNLFLAWLPYLFSLIVVLFYGWPRPTNVANHYRRAAWLRWLAITPAVLWLVFFPNAPYMITDLLHLRERPPVPLWYDIGLIATFVWTGLFLGVVSLSAMQTVVKDLCGGLASWLFVFGVAILSGLGIYMGRFQNWNSWDLFTQPDDIALDMLRRLLHPHLQMYGVSLMFAAFILICYLTFVSMRHPPQITNAAQKR